MSLSFTVSKASPEDAEGILDYLKIVGGETDNLTFGAEGVPFSPEEERSYIASLENSKCSVMLVAKSGDEVIGIASFSGTERERMRHHGELGVSVKKAFWGKGVGSALIKEIISFAKDTAKTEIISLNVRSDNLRAIRLYEKYGFEKIGCFRNFMKINGRDVDCDLMNLYL